MKMKTIIPFLSMEVLISCGSDDVLTKKEMETQSKDDAIVAGVLFDNEMDDKASYKVSKDGDVTIKFSESVKEKDYTKIVKLLRDNKNIDDVYAEQSGREVCGMPR